MQELWMKAAEFGLVGFLLVIVITGVGFALWKLGSRLVDATIQSMQRQNAAIERTSVAIEKISTMTAVIASQSEAVDGTLNKIASSTTRNARVMRIMLSALREITPQEKTRLQELIDEARRELDA
ncbi:MAG: hypothetical protein R3E01_11610 [Pirellulaceae bacterium]|nr:hypothetical protein [Planctomycetales bacterium]